MPNNAGKAFNSIKTEWNFNAFGGSKTASVSRIVTPIVASDSRNGRAVRSTRPAPFPPPND